MVASERSAKRSRTSSRERSCSSETHVLASSTILDSAAAQLQSARLGLVMPDQPKVVAKEKKLEKRPSATRRSLSRRVKQNYPRRDTATLLKPQLSQGESIISFDSDSQDFPKDESPSLKVVRCLESQFQLLFLLLKCDTSRYLEVCIFAIRGRVLIVHLIIMICTYL